MRSILTGRALVIGLLAGITGAAAVLAACSSSSNTGNGSNNNNNGGDASTTQAACTNNNALSILFSPMYSAYDGTHMFQIPAVVNGIDNSAVQWSASDSSMVSIAPDTDTGGIMITVNKAGSVTINAQAGGLCGTSTLNITAAQESDWETGNARYNNNIPVDRHCLGNVGGTYMQDGGVVQCPDAGPACSNCHGPTATSQVFTDISHTPEQTGGFSDQDLINIVVNGTVPDGGYFDNSIVPYQFWQRFHTWSDITGDQAKGIVVYLRSLTPSAQMGGANFGGHYDGGGHHHDGGYGPPPMDGGGPSDDAGTSNDSGTQGD